MAMKRPFPGFEDAWEVIHSNSLMYRPETNHYYLLSKYLDALLKIDRATGEVVWQFGGVNSDMLVLESQGRWGHPHMSHLWDGGMMIFDNGHHYDVERSRIAEYKWDEELMQARLVWEYWDPEDRFIMMMGDARKLPNGNYLASWFSAGMITEITREKEVVWRLTSDLGAAVSRVHFFRDIYDLKIHDPSRSSENSTTTE
jgi:hypothetical protein